MPPFRTLKNHELKEARNNAKLLEPDAELSAMMRCETEQINKKDKFWGVDFEYGHKIINQKLMEKEYLLSAENERFHKIGLQQRAWEAQYQIEGQNEAFDHAVKEMSTRDKYMKALFQADSSEIVYTFEWDRSHLPESQIHNVRVNNNNNTTARRGGMNNNGDAAFKDQSLAVINPDHLGGQLMFHLEGIQQARALSLDERKHGSPSKSKTGGKTLQNSSLGPLMRGRASTPGLIQDKMMSMVHSRSDVIDDPIGGKNNSQQQQLQHSQSQASFLHMFGGFQDPNGGYGAFGESGIVVKPVITEEMKRNSQAHNGHPYFKWDQEVILREVFDSLDTSHTGVLYPQDVARIASSSQIQYLLSFTVYGAWVKKRKWTVLLDALFGNVMDDMNNSIVYDHQQQQQQLGNNVSGQTPDQYNGNLSSFGICGDNNQGININKWFFVALALSRETNKSLRHVRTDAEHLELLTWNDNYHSLEGNNIEFAAQARMQHSKCCRDEEISKSAIIGDVIWALHNGGVRWMPAVIENINEDGTWNIKYPLSQVQLRGYRKKAKGNEILTGKIINPLLKFEKNGTTFKFKTAQGKGQNQAREGSEEGKSAGIGMGIYASHLKSSRKKAVVDAVLSQEIEDEDLWVSLNSILEYTE